jgi:uncharacterized membrane protein
MPPNLKRERPRPRLRPSSRDACMRLFLEMSAAVSKGFVMFDRVIRSVLAGVCALMLSGTSADAWFKVRNSTSRTVSIAFMTPIDNACFADVRWWIRGWWNIAPGQEAIVLGGDLEWVEYYVHIADDRGPWGAAGPSVTRSRFAGPRVQYLRRLPAPSDNIRAPHLQEDRNGRSQEFHAKSHTLKRAYRAGVTPTRPRVLPGAECPTRYCLRIATRRQIGPEFRSAVGLRAGANLL